MSDGQENLKQSQVSEETFLSKAKMSDLRTNKKQKSRFSGISFYKRAGLAADGAGWTKWL